MAEGGEPSSLTSDSTEDQGWAVERAPLLPIGKIIPVDITASYSLVDFYVTLQSERKNLTKLTDNLARDAEDGLPNFVIGNTECQIGCTLIQEPCVQWARCKVLELREDGKLSVLLIDSGRTIYLKKAYGNDTEHVLKYLTERYRKIPPFAYHCKMDVIPGPLYDGVWDPRLSKALLNLGKNDDFSCGEPFITAKCTEIEGDKNVVGITAYRRAGEWGAMLVKAGFAQRPPKPELSSGLVDQLQNLSVDVGGSTREGQQLSRTKAAGGGMVELEPQANSPEDKGEDLDNTNNAENEDEDPEG